MNTTQTLPWYEVTLASAGATESDRWYARRARESAQRHAPVVTSSWRTTAESVILR
jgi:hypothetical protein